MCLFLQSHYATMRAMHKVPVAYKMCQSAIRAGNMRDKPDLWTLSDARQKVRDLPDAQKRIFLLMCDFWVANDQLPTLQTIADRMGYRSVNAAQQAVLALEGKGLLERNEAQRLRFRRIDGMNLGEVFRTASTSQTAG